MPTTFAFMCYWNIIRCIEISEYLHLTYLYHRRKCGVRDDDGSMGAKAKTRNARANFRRESFVLAPSPNTYRPDSGSEVVNVNQPRMEESYF